MALFTPGTGTIKSGSLEAAALEVAQRLQNAEEANVPVFNFCSVGFDTDLKRATIVANIPITLTTDAATGNVSIVADLTSYISPAFDITGSDVKAATLPGAMIELFQRIQSLELAQSTANNVNVQYDSEARFARISATLPCDFPVNAVGKPEVTATPYLA